MVNFPVYTHKPMIVINTGSEESLGKIYSLTGASPFAGAWPLANLALFIPFSLGEPITALRMYLYNGNIVNGNVDIGIYSEDGTKLVSSGSTVHAGLNNLQEFNITDTIIGPGIFYMALSFSGNVATVSRFNLVTMLSSVVGMAQMENAFPLPANAVFATCAYGFIPIMGICVGGPGFI
jgi:hypothetical protein